MMTATPDDVDSLMMRGFATFYSNLKKNQKSDRGKRVELYISKATRYIENNIRKRIFVSDIAEYVGLEHSYFYRIFKKKIGISPEKYLIVQRIEKSKKYIQAGVAFKDIPALIGVNDIYYFFKIFKKVTGITPSEYKKTVM